VLVETVAVEAVVPDQILLELVEQLIQVVVEVELLLILC
jgi:hypothetical protein